MGKERRQTEIVLSPTTHPSSHKRAINSQVERRRTPPTYRTQLTAIPVHSRSATYSQSSHSPALSFCCLVVRRLVVSRQPSLAQGVAARTISARSRYMDAPRMVAPTEGRAAEEAFTFHPKVTSNREKARNTDIQNGELLVLCLLTFSTLKTRQVWTRP